MALWQFITLAVLIGTLLVYASVITRRLGGVNTRLNRIEEALLAKSPAIVSAAPRSAEVRTETSVGSERRGSYLTIRDLRASEPLDLPSMRAVSEDSAATSLEDSEAPATNSGPENPPDDHPPTDDSAAKKNRDMMLFLSNQRRRRRARLGY